MNSTKITDAIMQVRARIQSMSPEELRREFDAFQTTDVYDLLLNSGHFESNVDEFEDPTQAEAVTITVPVFSPNQVVENQNPICVLKSDVTISDHSAQSYVTEGWGQCAA